MSRRNYHQYCGLAAALDVLGERWTLLIVRELLLGPRRYGELLAELPGIGTNLLADRLKGLVEQGVLRRCGDGGNERAYELTEVGEQLRGPVLGLARWGLSMLGAPSEDELMRPHWGFLAVQAMLDPARASSVNEGYEFHVDEAIFHITVEDGRPHAIDGPFPGAPSMTAITDAATFLEIGGQHVTPFEAVASGRLALSGEPEAIIRCSVLLGLTASASIAAALLAGHTVSVRARTTRVKAARHPLPGGATPARAARQGGAPPGCKRHVPMHMQLRVDCFDYNLAYCTLTIT